MNSAARLLKVSAGAVRTQRQLFERRFAAAIAEIPLAAPPSEPRCAVCHRLRVAEKALARSAAL